MNAKELRIGNIINEVFDTPENPKSKRLFIVCSINGKYGTLINEEESITQIEYCEPIQLTDELLLKCGFEKEKSNDVFERTIYSIQVANGTSLYFDAHKDWMRDDKDVEWYLSHEWNNNNFKNDFWGCPKYLHQLQNLFYSLSGEELNVENMFVSPIEKPQ